jgi:CBS domain-containing protein
MTRLNVQEVTANDVMSRNLVTVEPLDDVSTALGKMKANDINEVPVVSDGRVLGLVSYEILLKKRSIPMTTKVENVMSFPPRVKKSDTIMDIAETMLSSGYRAVPVADREKIIGIVSRTDLLGAISKLRILREITVQEIMTEHPHWICEDDSIDQVRSVIYKLDVRALPVVDKKDKLVGVIGLKDIANISSYQKTRQTRGDTRGGKSSTAKIDVRSVMNTPPITINQTAQITEAVELMRKHDISTVVVTERETPVGIITQYDLIELIASFKKEDQVFVQISGLHETDSHTYDVMFELIQKYIKRLGKIVTPKVFTIHVHIEGGGPETSGNVTLRGRLTTEHEMFFASAEDWDIMKASSELLSQMERMVRKEKEKQRDLDRQSAR